MKLEYKNGMVAKAVDVVQSCKTYQQFLVADKYLNLLYRKYNVNYSQIQFLSNVYVDSYNRVL